MELVALARVLWRCRIAVTLGGVAAIALSLLITTSATSRVGVASMRLVLDTPKSQTVDAYPAGLETLEWRAALLADLMAAEPTREQIAREMGIATESLVVTAPLMSVAPVPVPLPRHALDVAAVVAEPYRVEIQAVSPLPIIGIDARAPSRQQAARLVTIGAVALKAAAASELTSEGERLVVGDVGPVRAREVVEGPRRMVALVIAVFVFGLWCGCITLVAGVSRGPGRLSGMRTSQLLLDR